MKKTLLIFSLAILSACSGSKDQSDAYGTFEADEIIISSEVSGKLSYFNADQGDQLSEGKIIGLIDTTDYQLKKEQLMAQKSAVASKSGNIAAQIDAQMQQKKNLLIEKNRIEKLFKDGAATSKQVDDINGSIDLIDKQISTIRTQNTSVADELLAYDKQIAQMEENIRRCHIIAPAAGTLLEKYALPNELLIPGKAVYKFANLEEIYLRAYISGSQLPLIKTGQKVEVLVDGVDGAILTHQGEIVWISSSAEFTPKIIQTREERVNLVYAIKVKVKNDGTLKIGMPGEVNFTTTDAR